MKFFVVVVLALVAAVANGKVLTEEQFRAELAKNSNIPEDDYEPWACIAEHVSNFNTAKVTVGADFGIFQISKAYWCSAGSQPGKGCDLRCDDLIDDDIKDDIECALKIKEEHGFYAWAVYVDKCT